MTQHDLIPYCFHCMEPVDTPDCETNLHIVQLAEWREAQRPVLTTKGRLVGVDASPRCERAGYVLMEFRIPYSDWIHAHQAFQTMSTVVDIQMKARVKE